MTDLRTLRRALTWVRTGQRAIRPHEERLLEAALEEAIARLEQGPGK